MFFIADAFAGFIREVNANTGLIHTVEVKVTGGRYVGFDTTDFDSEITKERSAAVSCPYCPDPI
jgi:hypothetical protein